MFERFTPRGRRIPVVAMEEARALQHASIGSEHLLLAILRDEDGLALEVLRANGVTYEAAQREVEHAVGVGTGVISGHTPFTPNAKKALELALREALQLRHDFIVPEHVALALARERDTVAARVLAALDVDTDALRADLLARADEFRTRADVDPGPWATTRGRVAGIAASRNPPTIAWERGPTGALPGPTELRCSLCSRSEARLARVLVTRGIAICDQCVEDLAQMLASIDPDQGRVVRFLPRAVAPPDVDRATSAIEQAFAVVFGVLRRPVDEQVEVIEDGPELRDLVAGWDRASAHLRHLAVDVTVERVRFVDEHTAEVSLGVWMPGNTTSPMIQPARAVEIEGAWKVSRDTVVRFAQLAGARFPPPHTD